MATAVEQTYRYARPSAVSPGRGATEVLLSASGGTTTAGPAEHPSFFDGFLENAEQAAGALLTVAKVARTRFFVPPGMLASILRAAGPVVTSNGDRLFGRLGAAGRVGFDCAEGATAWPHHAAETEKAAA